MAERWKRIMDFFGLDEMRDEVQPADDHGVRGGRHVDLVDPSFTSDTGGSGRSSLEVLGSPRVPGQQTQGGQGPGGNQRQGAYQIVTSEDRGARAGADIDMSDRGPSGVGRVARISPPPKRASESCANDVSVIRPKEFRDASKVADCLLDNQPVIVNLEVADKELTRRMIDFCAGAAYALQGTMEKVAEQVFLLRPPGRGLSAQRNGAVRGR
jgi:FtsZ-interacting cell division protein YlmF